MDETSDSSDFSSSPVIHTHKRKRPVKSISEESDNDDMDDGGFSNGNSDVVPDQSSVEAGSSERQVRMCKLYRKKFGILND